MNAASQTLLFYGLTVRACDLIAASRAFAASKDAQDTLGMIARRQERGTLRVAPGQPAAITKVPVEVWGMVRHALVPIAVTDARVDLMEDFHCPDCHEMDVRVEMKAFRQAKIKPEDFMRGDGEAGTFEESVDWVVWAERCDFQHAHVWSDDWADHSQELPCDCYEDPFEYIVDVDFWDTALREDPAVNALLRTYGLEYPITMGHTATQSSSRGTFSSAMTAVALYRPDVATPSNRLAADAENPETLRDLFPEPMFAAVDDSFFQIPPDAARRFERFRRDYSVGCAEDTAAVKKPRFHMVSLLSVTEE